MEQKKYSKKEILYAAEIGEINHIEAQHIVNMLDEAVCKLYTPDAYCDTFCPDSDDCDRVKCTKF